MRTRVLLVASLVAASALGAEYPVPSNYTCYRAEGPIHVDGRLTESSWIKAPKSNAFVDIVTGKPAFFDTRVALVWDDDYLYFGYTVEEPFVQATLTERDSKIYIENDIEMFIAGKDAYYELELNALNTIYEVFWIWKDVYKAGSPYFGVPEFDVKSHPMMTLSGVGGHEHPRGERWGFLDWDLPGLRHAVFVNGTLNNPKDRDRGWTVELAVPWKGLKWLADGRSLPPKASDVWQIDCSRFQKYDREGKPMDGSAGWTWNCHGHMDSHIPETFTRVRFSNDKVGRE